MASPLTTSAPTVAKQPNLNPSPKVRFRESADNISKHRAMVESREFERALDFAQLEYSGQVVAQTKDANSALAAGLKIQGMVEFCHVLRTLSEQQRVNVTQPTDNLPSNLS